MENIIKRDVTTKSKLAYELGERVDIPLFRTALEKLTGKKSQLVDAFVHYVEAVQYNLETDDFIAGQDIVLWAALDLFIDVVQYQADMDKDPRLTTSQHEYVADHIGKGINDAQVMDLLIENLPDSEIRDIILTMDKETI